MKFFFEQIFQKQFCAHFLRDSVKTISISTKVEVVRNRNKYSNLKYCHKQPRGLIKYVLHIMINLLSLVVNVTEMAYQ